MWQPPEVVKQNFLPVNLCRPFCQDERATTPSRKLPSLISYFHLLQSRVTTMSSCVPMSDVLDLIDLTAQTRSSWEEVGAEFITIASELQSLGSVLSSQPLGIWHPPDLPESHPGGTSNLRRLMGDCKILVSKLHAVVDVVPNSQLTQYRYELNTCVQGLKNRSPKDKNPLGDEDTAQHVPKSK